MGMLPQSKGPGGTELGVIILMGYDRVISGPQH